MREYKPKVKRIHGRFQLIQTGKSSFSVITHNGSQITPSAVELMSVSGVRALETAERTFDQLVVAWMKITK